MCEAVRLQRLEPDVPWGFRLTGGLDFGTPISVVKVTGGSIAAQAGIEVGDIILEINKQSAQCMTHTEAQNCIVRCGNLINLVITRGTVVSPALTPFRGMTPDITYKRNDSFCDSFEEYPHPEVDFNDNDFYCDYGNEKEFGTAPSESAVSDLEIDELLTGHEEVLDQGILGINFQKFIPQVDFIRHSEVFKVLQSENTKKEVPEQVQLEKEPTKRFSTFLQKPQAPPPAPPSGPYWFYPKAPNYLPRNKETDSDESRMKKREKKENGHSVLWLFLSESKDHVVDERWGTPDEERVNESRNTNRDDEGVIMPLLPSRTATPMPAEKTDKVMEKHAASKLPGETNQNQPEDSQMKSNVSSEIEQQDDQNGGKDSEKLENQECSTNKLEDTITESIDCTKLEEESRYEPVQDSNSEENVIDVQISEIQNQLSSLEGDGELPENLSAHLTAIQEQLKRILELNQCQKQKALEEDEEKLEDQIEDDLSELDNGEVAGEDELIEGEPKSSSCDEDTMNNYTFEAESAQDNLESTDEMHIECFERGDFEMCRTPGWPPKVEVKKKFHPLTPAPRPIVLPGGRQWRRPKDASHDEFYQGILVEQADVLLGNNASVNFKKYVPPKFDTSHSHVFKLIQEIESRAGDESKPEADYYQPPIDKRTFYLATLPEPSPIGVAELRDIDADIAVS